MKSIFLIIGLALVNPWINAQADFTIVIDSSLSESNQILFMQNTVRFYEPFYSALEKFPELANLPIEVKRKQIFTMMAARPGRGFIFHPRNKRRYVILITNRPDMNADSIYSQVEPNAIVGLFGHELSHLLEYQEKNNFRMLCFGIGYFFNRKKIEHRTDMVAIQRGFGDELIKYNEFIRKNQFVNKQYLHRKEKYYLSETDIETSMKRTAN